MRAEVAVGCQQAANGLTQTLAHQNGWPMFSDTPAEVPTNEAETANTHKHYKFPIKLYVPDNHWQPHLKGVLTSANSAAAVATLAVSQAAAELSALPPKEFTVRACAPSAAGYSCWTRSTSSAAQQQPTLPQAGAWPVAAVAGRGSTDMTFQPPDVRIPGCTDPSVPQKGHNHLRSLSYCQPEHPAWVNCPPWFTSGSTMFPVAPDSQEAASPCHTFASGETPTALAALPPGLLDEVIGLEATSTACTYHCRPCSVRKCSPESGFKPDASACTEKSVSAFQLHATESPCSSASAWSCVSQGGREDSSCTSSNRLETYPPSTSNTSSNSLQVCYADDSACTAALHQSLQLAIHQLSTLQIGEHTQCGGVPACTAGATGIACPASSANTGSSTLRHQHQQGARQLYPHSSSVATGTHMERSSSELHSDTSRGTFVPGLLPSAPWTAGCLTRAPALQQAVRLTHPSALPWAPPAPQGACPSTAYSSSCQDTPGPAEAVEPGWMDSSSLRPADATGSSRSVGGPDMYQARHTVGCRPAPVPPPAPALCASAYESSGRDDVKQITPAAGAAAALCKGSPSQGTYACPGPEAGLKTICEHRVATVTNRSMPCAAGVAAGVTPATKGTGVFVRLDAWPASSKVLKGGAPASTAVSTASMKHPCCMENNGVSRKGTGAFIPHAVRVAVAAAAAAQQSIQP